MDKTENRFYRELGPQDGIEAAVLAERERCINLICPHCASGAYLEKDGTHILETIQGHASWTKHCQAHALRQS